MTLAVPHAAGQDHGVHSLNPPSVGAKAEHNILESESSTETIASLRFFDCCEFSVYFFTVKISQ